MEGVAKFLDTLVPIGAPLDLIKSMYATPQPAALLEDIRNFTAGLDHASAIYIARWPVDGGGGGDDHDLWDWLSNDLISYMNLNQATMYGYVDSFYKCWDKYLPDKIWGWNPRIARRTFLMPLLHIPEEDMSPERRQLYRHTIPLSRRNFINNFITSLGSLNSKTESRIYWAALTPTQRVDFIQNELEMDANDIQ
jgi:hypothetical protein